MFFETGREKFSIVILSLQLIYRKVSKFSSVRKFAVIYLKFKQKGQCISSKRCNEIANSEDPDQTAPLGAV